MSRSRGYRYCECECDCDCDDAPELSSDGKAALLKAIDAAELLRRVVPAWFVVDAEWLIADLEKVAGELGLESGAAKAAKIAKEAREKRERERQQAEKERADYLRLASVLGISVAA